MAELFWVARPLTSREEDYLRGSSLGSEVAALGPLSIMGRSNHPYVDHENVKHTTWRIYVGNTGQYIDESSRPIASGGKKVAVLWGERAPSSLLIKEAQSLHIPIIQSWDLMYFERVYNDAFLDCFHYADFVLHRLHERRPFFSFLLPGRTLHLEEMEYPKIRQEMRKIISKTISTT